MTPWNSIIVQLRGPASLRGTVRCRLVQNSAMQTCTVTHRQLAARHPDNAARHRFAASATCTEPHLHVLVQLGTLACSMPYCTFGFHNRYETAMKVL